MPPARTSKAKKSSSTTTQRKPSTSPTSTAGQSKPSKAKSPRAKSAGKIKGISRIDQPAKKNHGWFVRVSQNNKTYCKFFRDAKHGGRAKALESAKEGLEKLRAKYPKVSRRKTAMIPRRPNPYGLIGVTKVVKSSPNGKEYAYWIATWSPRIGQVAKKMFSVKRYGDKKAMELAIKARRQGVREMED